MTTNSFTELRSVFTSLQDHVILGVRPYSRLQAGVVSVFTRQNKAEADQNMRCRKTAY